jgi:hypothetical protein
MALLPEHTAEVIVETNALPRLLTENADSLVWLEGDHLWTVAKPTL